MRALALSLAAFLLAATQPAFALERLTLQLRGEPDAAAAGYIIAHERGIFADHGLDVSIKPGGSGIDPAQTLGEGGADIAADLFTNAIRARQRGVPLVNIAQIVERAGMLEDGLYVLEDSLVDPVMSERLARFLKAAIEGWDHALSHPAEAVAALTAFAGDDGIDATREGEAIDELAAAIDTGTIGYLDPAHYQRAVDTLKAGGETAPLDSVPAGMWSHSLYDAASAM